jgi:hypothetical protein
MELSGLSGRTFRDLDDALRISLSAQRGQFSGATIDTWWYSRSRRPGNSHFAGA